MKAALYARVSTFKRKLGELDREPAWKQDPEVQLQPLRQLAALREWEIHDEYVDRESGVKEDRARLVDLLADATRGAFKVVVVWKFDRMARTMKQLVTTLDHFRVLGIDFVSHTEAVDTSTSMGRAMFGMLAVFAELERETIRERVRAGIERRRAKGLPIGRQRKVFDRERAWEMRQAGTSWGKIAMSMGVPKPSVIRAVREFTAEALAGPKSP